MQKRGGGRFGKYGDLKRKEKIRQTRVLKRNDKVKAGAQCAVEHSRRTGPSAEAEHPWRGWREAAS